MAKAAVLPFKPRLIDCDADTRELLGALLSKAIQGKLAGVLVTFVCKDGEEHTCTSGSMHKDLDKALAACSRTALRLADV